MKEIRLDIISNNFICTLMKSCKSSSGILSLQNFPDLMISVVEFPIIDYLLRQDVISRKVSSLQ